MFKPLSLEEIKQIDASPGIIRDTVVSCKQLIKNMSVIKNIMTRTLPEGTPAMTIELTLTVEEWEAYEKIANLKESQ